MRTYKLICEIAKRATTLSSPSNLLSIFGSLDVNNDGYIDKTDLENVLSSNHHEYIDALIEECDDDNDNKLSFNEFKKAMIPQ